MWKISTGYVLCVAGKAIVLSTLGVVITAGITILLCKFLLGLSLQESFLIGAVLSSTDAVSVFGILVGVLIAFLSLLILTKTSDSK